MKIYNSYEEFCKALNADCDDVFQTILDYPDFQIFREVTTGRYFYIERGENDASDFYEVECIAHLYYDIINDIQIKDGEMLHRLFDCDICGECVFDDHIEYLWFKIKNHIEYLWFKIKKECVTDA